MAYTEQLLQHPFSMIVSGPSKAGKTCFTYKLLHNIKSMSTQPPTEIIWCYSEYQPGYEELLVIPGLKLVQGLPDLDSMRENTHAAKLLVLDDLMSSAKDSAVTNLFTKGAHHWGISLVFIVQNLFFGGTRTARVNAHYLVLFKNPADKLQISTLARQLYPQKRRMFMEAFQDATAHPHSYLLVDLTQGCPEELRLRAYIFPDQLTIVYS